MAVQSWTSRANFKGTGRETTLNARNPKRISLHPIAALTADIGEVGDAFYSAGFSNQMISRILLISGSDASFRGGIW